MIRARGLEKRYGAKRVLRGLDLDVPAGEFVLVTGPNGSGKTTLLKILAGLEPPSTGIFPWPKSATCTSCGAPRRPRP